jgi:RND family efflux transporter MFP subunit
MPPIRLLLPLVATLALVACGKPGEAPTKPAGPAGAAQAPGGAASASVLLLASEDIRVVQPTLVAGGPVITGALQPERRADLRSEISAVVTQVLRDNGEAVKTGELLVRLDDTSIRDSLASAEESARAAAQALEQTERSLQRLRTLQQQGMTSTQAVEDAEVRRNSAQSESVAAKARVVSARQQLRRTEVRAPFDGVVSDRKVSAGDTAAIGKELLKVIDPGSLRVEGLVSADRLQELKVGQPVSLRVNGFGDQLFTGKVRRIDSAANATTRQVAVLVAFDDPKAAPRVAGLFAEGRIETGGTQQLMLPEGTVIRSGDAAHAWKVGNGVVQKVALKLGERDARSGDFPVISGLAAGDRVLRAPAGTLVDGQKFELAKPAAPAASAASGPASPR